MDRSLPLEILYKIFDYLSIIDLARLERTSRLHQSIALDEIERRIIRSKTAEEEWGILVSIKLFHYYNPQQLWY
ncbi:hypothetical protein BDF20DRAFT_894799 [Mycotypha africana]|uniref:uncharacterized protein n=1 Tax=Mycotypha africana TaxID=64632 RepID=UPI002300A3AE|nr:uncharacterized protein BDF20DRAFT_894799 [Mycotypha africana]KAI8968162.1 hypothetical protein BDF20DRAFT_894799 [Mycotypha africana]